MTSTQDPDLLALAEVTTDLVAALGSIEDQHWNRPTPCSEWDLTALVDHITGGNWFTAHILGGASADGAMAATIAQFDDRPATSAAATESTRTQFDAFEQAGALDGSWHHVVGVLTGRQILRLRLHDLIVHTWDVNQTLRPPASVPTNLARWGLHELADDDSLMSEHFQLPGTSGASDPIGDLPSAYLRAFDR